MYFVEEKVGCRKFTIRFDGRPTTNFHKFSQDSGVLTKLEFFEPESGQVQFLVECHVMGSQVMKVLMRQLT